MFHHGVFGQTDLASGHAAQTTMVNNAEFLTWAIRCKVLLRAAAVGPDSRSERLHVCSIGFGYRDLTLFHLLHIPPCPLEPPGYLAEPEFGSSESEVTLHVRFIWFAILQS